MQAVDSAVAQAMKRAIVSNRTFGPLVPQHQLLDAAPSFKDSAEMRNSKNAWVAEKYRAVLKHFKSASRQNFDQVCQVLGMWLKDENICNPEDLLPDDLFGRLTETTKSVFADFRPAEKIYADMGIAFLPYFTVMLGAYRKLRVDKVTSIPKALEELGFDRDAVRALLGGARNPRSAIAAACRFVADRNSLDENTIRTAFSRIYPEAKKPTVRRKKGDAV
jgi:hypothetical protein